MANELIDINESVSEVKDCIDSKDRAGLEESYKELFEQYQELKDQLPENISSKYDVLLNYATKAVLVETPISNTSSIAVYAAFVFQAQNLLMISS
ncbi:hypothetical protein [Bariatricus sp. HCP28S3_C2]|uniref:hypothetical protein n=1 Tax=unclassified Bariatricus TaxID=2677046 RepID=UPI003F89FA22